MFVVCIFVFFPRLLVEIVPVFLFVCLKSGHFLYFLLGAPIIKITSFIFQSVEKHHLLNQRNCQWKSACIWMRTVSITIVTCAINQLIHHEFFVMFHKCKQVWLHFFQLLFLSNVCVQTGNEEAEETEDSSVNPLPRKWLSISISLSNLRNYWKIFTLTLHG